MPCGRHRPFLGLLAHNIGYPDGILAGLFVVASNFIFRISALSIALILIIFSATHEIAFLLMLPVVLFSAAMRQDWGRRDFAVVGLGALLGLYLPLAGGAVSSALISRMIAVGLTPHNASLQVTASLRQGLFQNLGVMIGKWYECFPNALFGVAYAGLPGICITWLGFPSAAAWVARRTQERYLRRLLRGAYVFSCLAGWAILAIAWDLARIASFTTLTAFMTAALVMRHAPRRPEIGAVIVGALVAIGFAGLPILNLYFEFGRPLHVGLVNKICSPCAVVGIKLIDAFNRAMTPEERTRIDADPYYGNTRIDRLEAIRTGR